MRQSTEDKEHLDNRPIIFIHLDLDDTLLRTGHDVIHFHGSEVDNDPGLWKKEFDQLKSLYGGLINFQFRILTARPRAGHAGSTTFTAAKYLNLFDIDSRTGKDLARSTTSCAYHFPEIWIVDDLKEQANKSLIASLPNWSFVWVKSTSQFVFKHPQHGTILSTHEDGLEQHKKVKDSLAKLNATKGCLSDYITQPPSKEQVAIIQSLHQEVFYKKYSPFPTAYYESLVYYNVTHVQKTPAPVVSTISYLQSTFIPAIHLTPTVPKAVVMDRARHEPWTKGRTIIGSILVDDRKSHLDHFSTKDTWIDASQLKGATDSKTATSMVLGNLREQVHNKIVEHFKFDAKKMNVEMFKSELNHYYNVLKTATETRPWDHWYNRFFTSTHKSTKMTCIKKILQSLASEDVIKFSEDDINAAQHGNLKKIIERYRKRDLLPKQFIITEKAVDQKNRSSSLILWGYGE